MQSRTMMLATALVLALMSAPAAWARGACPIVSNDHLSCKFGLDWVVNGKLDRSRELWDLQCFRRGEAVSCDLTSTQLIPLFPENWVVVDVHYASADGGLILHDDRWMEGAFLFDVVQKEGSRYVITMRFANDQNTQSLDLVEFKASSVQRGLFSGDVEAIELRIPEYTTTVQVPITLPGMHSADEKQDADLRRSLTPKDREAYDRFVKSPCMKNVFEKPAPEDAMRPHCPDVAALLDKNDTTTKPTPQQLRCVAEAMTNSLQAAMRACLADAGLSPRGQEQVLLMMAKAFDVDAMAEAMRKAEAMRENVKPRPDGGAGTTRSHSVLVP